MLKAYHESSDHPSVEDILSGSISVQDALKKGFEATFGGQIVVFFTDEKIGKKYEEKLEPLRTTLIKPALSKRGNMFPVKHSGMQTGVVERWTQANTNHDWS